MADSLAAAADRYKDLRTDIFVTLSERCSVDHVGVAATAVADMIRPELEDIYAALLEARAARDEALKRIATAEQELTDRIVERIMRIADAQKPRRRSNRAFHAGLVVAAGEAKVEHLFEPDGVS
jgi:hypothetical protein